MLQKSDSGMRGIVLPKPIPPDCQRQGNSSPFQKPRRLPAAGAPFLIHSGAPEWRLSRDECRHAVCYTSRMEPFHAPVEEFAAHV
jgi:hypothetical protein